MDKHAQAYKKLKETYREEILLYQVGIFYKIMFEDAKRASNATGLKLLLSGEAEDPVMICGFPQSGLDKYAGKLLRAGFSAAIWHSHEAPEIIRCLKKGENA